MFTRQYTYLKPSRSIKTLFLDLLNYRPCLMLIVLMLWCTYGIRANYCYNKNQYKDTLRRLSNVNVHHYLDNNTHHPQTVLWSK